MTPLGWLGHKTSTQTNILHHWGIQLIFAYSWARPAILVAGKGSYWRNVFISSVSSLSLIFLFTPCSSLSFIISSISFLPFSGRWHKMTHKGWRVVKPQHNQSILKLNGCFNHGLKIGMCFLQILEVIFLSLFFTFLTFLHASVLWKCIIVGNVWAQLLLQFKANPSSTSQIFIHGLKICMCFLQILIFFFFSVFFLLFSSPELKAQGELLWSLTVRRRRRRPYVRPSIRPSVHNL